MGLEVDVRVAIGKSDDADGGVEHGAILARYAEATLDATGDVETAQTACVAALGASATIQAASIIASFDGINRVADATGIRLDPENEARGASDTISSLELEGLGAARA